MFIKELILKNFAGIHATMKTKYIRIDFSKRKHNICLIAGPNGKGKTVLLSQLNPFATLGTLDVRDNLPLILSKKEGYKKIVIQDGENEYLIEHFYHPSKDTHLVKSYIKKNGEELNINGNVTSFKEIVSHELELEPDYMKLVRLGNNVSNLISLKATERKTFLSKLLEEANIYLAYYKKINVDVSSLKTLISHASDQLKRLPSEDEYTIKDLLSKHEDTLTDLEKKKSKLEEKKSVVVYNIKELGDLKTIMDLNQSSEKKLSKLESTLSKRGWTDISYEEVCEEEIKASKVYHETISKLERKKDRFETENKVLNDTLNQLDSCVSELEKVSSNIDVDDLLTIIDQLKKEVSKEEKKFEKYGEITYTKEDVEKAILFFKEKQDILNRIYEFGRAPIQRVIELLKQNQSVEDYIEDHLKAIEKNDDILDAKRFIKKIKSEYGDIIPKCKHLDCKLLNIWEEIEKIAEGSHSDIIDDKDFFIYMNLSYTTIKSVILSFKEEKELFLRLPDHIRDLTKIEVLYEKIRNTDSIYDSSIMNELSFITDYDNFLKKKEELKQKKEELKKIETNSTYAYLVNLKSSLDDKSSVAFKTCEMIRNEIKELTGLLEHDRKNLESFSELKDIVKDKDQIKEQYEQTSIQITSYKNYQEELKELQHQILLIDDELTKEKENVRYYQISYEECRKLNKELGKLKTHYEDLNILRDSLSSKDGIPLLFIKLYLQNAKKTINELLDGVYGGSMYITDFVISANEFNIPFVKDDIEVSDIRYASQGESSFFSIALSFAISYQSMSRYNVMLLDELDSVLDESNRQKFISIIEKQMDLIQSEQIFIISHNNMFSMYPVDLISVVDTKKEYGKLTNQIMIEKDEKEE